MYVAKVLHLDDVSFHPLRFLFANFQRVWLMVVRSWVQVVGGLNILLKGRDTTVQITFREIAKKKLSLCNFLEKKRQFTVHGYVIKSHFMRKKLAISKRLWRGISLAISQFTRKKGLSGIKKRPFHLYNNNNN